MTTDPPDPGPAQSGPAPSAAPQQLAPEIVKAIGDVLAQFRVAFSNVQLYKAGSQQAVKSAGAMFDPLARLLEQLQDLTLGEAGESMIVNGVELKLAGAPKSAAAGVAALMRRCGVRSLTFKVGVTLEECYALLDALRLAQASGAFKRESLAGPHIAADERVFVAVGEQDFVVDGKRLGQSRTIDELMEHLKRILDLTAVEDPAVRDKLRMDLARKLIQDDPAALARLEEQAREAKGDGLERDLQFPQDAMREIIAEAARIYKTFSGRFDAASAEGKAAEGLRRVLVRLLALAEGRADISGVLEDLIASGAGDLANQAARPAASTPAELAEQLASGDSLRLLDDDVRGRLPSLVKELDLAQKPELVDRVLDRFAENLGAATAAMRLKTAQALGEVLSAAKETSRPHAADRLDPPLLAAGEMEVEAQVYEKLVGLLADRADDLVGRGRYEGARDVIGMLRRHRNMKEGAFSSRAELATRGMEAMGHSGMMAVLVSDLLSSDAARQEKARELTIQLEELGVAALVEEIKHNEDLRMRKLLAAVAQNMGEGAVVRLVAQVKEETSANGLVRLMEVIRDLPPSDLAVDMLAGHVGHPDRVVRAALVDTLRHLRTEHAAVALLPLLSDGRREIRLAALEAVGELRAPAAVAPILAQLRAQPDDAELLVNACRVLGRIGDESAAGPLLALLRGAGWLGRLRAKPKEIRVAAARALGVFVHREDVKAALLALLQDKEPELRRAASEIFGVGPSANA